MAEPPRRFPPPWRADMVPGAMSSATPIGISRFRPGCVSAPRVDYTTLRTFKVRLPDPQSKHRLARSFPSGRGSWIQGTSAPHPQPRGREPPFRLLVESVRAIPMSNPGNIRRNCLTPAVRRVGIELRQARADRRAADLAPIVKEIRAAGVTSLKGIAAALNQRGIPTSFGHRRWYPMQVARLLRRLALR
jgi:hypothetical protein